MGYTLGTMMRGSSALAAILAAVVVAGCAWRYDPEYSSIEYAVSGTAANLTITAVTDEWGTRQTFSVASLPWSLDYDNEGLVMEPPVYLRVEVTPTGVPIATGSANSNVTDHLVDTTADFVALGVRVGDVARNPGSGAISLVTAVSTTDLTLTAGDDPFPLGTEAYEVYRMTSLTAAAYGDGSLLASTQLSGWQNGPLQATVISENYTVP